MIDADDPRYRPLWLRIAITAGALVWGVVELATGSPGFAMIFAALGLYAGWRLLITYAPDAPDTKED